MSSCWKTAAAAALLLTALTRSGGAAEDPPSPDQVIAKIASYKFGESRENLSAIEGLVSRAGRMSGGDDKLAAMLHPLLAKNATPDCKQFVCRQLAILGSKSSVAPLTPLLADEKSSDMARYALERIADPAAGQALLAALARSDGKRAIGIINSLGNREEEAATAALIERSQAGDAGVRAASIHALGKIGGEESARALLQLKEGATAELHLLAMQAFLACGDKYRAKSQAGTAKAIYESAFTAGEPVMIRVAAFRGLVALDEAQSLPLIVKQLGAPEPELQDAALSVVRDIPGDAATPAFVQQLAKLSPPRQALLLRALADRGNRSILPAVTSALDDEDESVRTAALYALGRVGGVDEIKRLARVASAAAGPEQAAARDSLVILRGDGVDAAIIAMLEKPAVKTRAQLAASLGPRNSVAAVPTLLQTARDSDPKVCLASVTSLGSLASERELPALIELLLAVNADARDAAAKAVVATARRIPEPDRRSTAVLSALSESKTPASRACLLPVVGQIGGTRAVAAVELALKDEHAEVREAAIKALAAWTAPEALSALSSVVKTSDVPAQRQLALQGYIRLLGVPSERPPRVILADYKAAFQLATRIDEKRQVVMSLPRVRVPETLTFLLPLLADPELSEDAARAAVQLSTVGRRSEISRDEARAAMRKVLAVTKVPATREAATTILESGEQR